MRSSKLLLILAVGFFLAVNTSYFWEAKLGVWDMLAFLILIVIFIVLIIGLLWQFYKIVRGRGALRRRALTVLVLGTVLALTAFRPAGLIDFERMEDKDVLRAYREGSANCTTTLKLKANKRFVENSICFGILDVNGSYSTKGDTIFFSDIHASRGNDSFYHFAVIKSMSEDTSEKSLYCYKSVQDTSPFIIGIKMNRMK